ncbi:hypothetical protein ID854_20495 [Xenorhabdus sp. M]|uniref:HEAT repeat domain-containing protein n=1 Tax=Xenorhabdus szentirmaii TaxID=290112 RepID=A0AAW3Z176_9GAMM|nr:hypothetical protein [Xenorhabdus sp. M]MBD2802754.1 hypothetical protein [Xenorhabdus sp. M]
MASEYFLLRQIEKIIMTSHPHEYRYFGVDKKDTAEALKGLSRHHNGQIRQRAVLGLGAMHEVSALPELI